MKKRALEWRRDKRKKIIYWVEEIKAYERNNNNTSAQQKNHCDEMKRNSKEKEEDGTEKKWKKNASVISSGWKYYVEIRRTIGHDYY